ncbi:MAG: hypothetical protein ACR2Q4_11390 [Geminicoccaceae bacterium]
MTYFVASKPVCLGFHVTVYRSNTQQNPCPIEENIYPFEFDPENLTTRTSSTLIDVHIIFNLARFRRAYPLGTHTHDI